jgi:hypothetical protein
MRKDPMKAMTSPIDKRDYRLLSTAEVRKARLQVFQHVSSKDAGRELLQMLGIYEPIEVLLLEEEVA